MNNTFKQVRAMQVKITFHNMDHSDSLEAHVNQKLEKLQELLKEEELPQNVEVRLRSGSLHAHHEVEIYLKTKHFNLNVSDEGPEMYQVFDQANESMTKVVKKEKSKLLDKSHKSRDDKRKFQGN